MEKKPQNNKTTFDLICYALNHGRNRVVSSSSSSMLCHHESSSDAASDDTCPLLSSDRGPGDLSPTSRLRRIEEGRKELMEMIRNVPESCFELSLKDIVVDLRQCPCPIGSGLEVDDKQGKKKKKKRMRAKSTSERPGRVMRTSSMEAGSFPIRMFLPVPAFLRPNMKQQQPASSSGNSSKTPMSLPRASLDRSDGRWPLTRDEWMSHEGTSRSKSCTSRIENGGGGFFSGCLPFGGLNNSKGKVMIESIMTRQNTCMF